MLAFSPDSRLRATAPFNYDVGAPPPEVHLYDTATGQLHLPPLRQRTFITCLAFSPDSQTLAVGQIGGTVLMDVANGGVRQFLPQRTVANHLAFSPDGQRLAVAYRSGWGGEGAGVRLWDVATGQPCGPFHPLGHGDWILPQVHFLDQGRLVLALIPDRRSQLLLFDGRTGWPREARFPQENVPLEVAVRPQDTVCAFSPSPGIVHQWDLAAGRAIGGPLKHPRPVEILRYSPDGRWLATATADHGARLWDSATGLPLGPPRLHVGPVRDVGFSADGRHLVSVSAVGEVQTWPLPEAVPDNPARLALWIEAAAGRRLLGTETAMLDPPVWQERCRELGRRWPKAAADLARQRGADFTAELAAWNETRAREATGHTFGLIWHLDRLAEQRPDDWRLDARRGRGLAEVGDDAAAETAFAAAARKGAGEALADWYSHGAALARAVKQWERARWYLDRRIAARPDDWHGYADRAEVFGAQGHAAARAADLEQAIDRGADPALVLSLADDHARHGRWPQAADAFARAVRRGPVPLGVWQPYALVRLQLADPAGYRQICQTLLGLAGEKVPPAVANAGAGLCALGPDAVADYRPVIALAERGVAGHTDAKGRHETLNTLGAVLVRAGRAREGLAKMEEGVAADGGKALAGDWLFLALAHHRLGDDARARECLARVPAPGPKEGAWTWADLEVAVLRREVAALVPAPER